MMRLLLLIMLLYVLQPVQSRMKANSCLKVTVFYVISYPTRIC